MARFAKRNLPGAFGVGLLFGLFALILGLLAGDEPTGVLSFAATTAIVIALILWAIADEEAPEPEHKDHRQFRLVLDFIIGFFRAFK